MIVASKTQFKHFADTISKKIAVPQAYQIQVRRHALQGCKLWYDLRTAWRSLTIWGTYGGKLPKFRLQKLDADWLLYGHFLEVRWVRFNLRSDLKGTVEYLLCLQPHTLRFFHEFLLPGLIRLEFRNDLLQSLQTMLRPNLGLIIVFFECWYVFVKLDPWLLRGREDMNVWRTRVSSEQVSV